MSWIKPEQDKHGRGRNRPRGPSLREVQKAICEGEKLGRLKYSRRAVSKSGWLAVDHYARFLILARQETTLHEDGIFFGRQIPEAKVDYLLFCVASLLTTEHAASRINRRGGGRDLVGETKTTSLLMVADASADSQQAGKGKVLANASVETKPVTPESGYKTASIIPVTPKRKAPKVYNTESASKSRKRSRVIQDDALSQSPIAGLGSAESNIAVPNWRLEVVTPKQRLALSATSGQEDLEELTQQPLIPSNRPCPCNLLRNQPKLRDVSGCWV